MVRKCERCGTVCNDVDHWTTCPHEGFGMLCRAVRSDGEERICTSIEELNSFLAKDLTWQQS